MKAKGSKLAFFPHYFKKIGLGLIIASGIIFLGGIIYTVNSSAGDLLSFKKIIVSIFENCLIIGLFILAFARDKQEDEMSLFLRFKAMAFAFIFGIIYAIIQIWSPALYSGGEESPLTITYLIIIMLAIYNLIYHLSKKAMNEKYDKSRKG